MKINTTKEIMDEEVRLIVDEEKGWGGFDMIPSDKSWVLTSDLKEMIEKRIESHKENINTNIPHVHEMTNDEKKGLDRIHTRINELKRLLNKLKI